MISSPDGQSTLRVGLDAIYKFEPRTLNGDWQNRDAIYAARPFLGGTVFRPWIRFLTEVELAQNPPYLLYSWLEVQPRPEIGFRIGQQDTPISRHENFGVMRTLLPETDVVAEYFWTGRDKGVTVFGALGNDRVDYYAGVYGGSPLRQFTTLAGNYVVERARHRESDRAHARQRVRLRAGRRAVGAARVVHAAGVLRQGPGRDRELQRQYLQLPADGDRDERPPGRRRCRCLVAGGTSVRLRRGVLAAHRARRRHRLSHQSARGGRSAFASCRGDWTPRFA